MNPQPFAPELLAWHRLHGRHDLPWQKDRTPYRVWVSEVMLQQTQVAAVIPYFERFMARFPDVRCAGRCAADEVLHLWSGLGYYARARNLQRAAQQVRDEHGGVFPDGLRRRVAALPGVGRSTAGAILALSRDQSHPIMDGNVRRVLSRLFAVPGRTRRTCVRERAVATGHAAHSATERVAQYTQAIMDLGATLCTRRSPRCGECPLSFALRRASPRAGRTTIPRRGSRWSAGSAKRGCCSCRRADGAVRLLRRPEQGVWGGLWSPPEFDSRQALEQPLAAQSGGVSRCAKARRCCMCSPTSTC